jgi:hypothetical protein
MFFHFRGLYRQSQAITLSLVAGASGISAMGNNMDYFDRFEIEREGSRLRGEELRRLENAAGNWLRAKFHSLYEKFAETLHLPHGA